MDDGRNQKTYQEKKVWSVFRKWGRNAVWKALKKKTKRLIIEGKRSHDKEKKTKLHEENINGFYNCVRAFVNDDKKKNWSPRELYPQLTEKETSERLADFFNILVTNTKH